MTALLGTEPVLGARVHVPGWGLPWIDATLTEPATLTGEQTFEIGGVTISATIVAGGPWQTRARYRLVGGKGGWGASVPAKAYNDDGGVKVSKVAQDLAAACGETLGPLPTTRRGPHYARDAKAAYLTLHELAPRAWYVDFDGVTQFGQRPETTYSGDATIVRNDQAARVVELALDTIDSTLVPGVSVAGNPPATDVEYELGPSRLTCRVFWGAPKLARRLDAYAQIFDALFPNLRYAGVFEYRVVTQEGERLNLQPVRVATGMPDLARVPVRPGVSGFRSDVTPGELVLVCFADRDPSRPQVFAHDHADSEGWLPSVSEIGEATDFLATKEAIDTLQQAFDDFTGTVYPAHTHPTGVGPSGPVAGSPPAPVGALPSTDILKASKA
jgi:hypothetical protein